MCIECDVEGTTARYTLRTTGSQPLGWMAIGFGRYMGDSAMVVVWPTRDADGNYSSVTLSQRKAPYETMPLPDLDPPFIAMLSLADTSVSAENPQIAFTRPAPEDGMQNIIWAFGRTSPESADADAPFSIHQRMGRGTLNLTRVAPSPAEPSESPEPSPTPTPPLHQPQPEESDEKVEDGSGGSASFVHGALCTAGFLLVLPSGALVARYAKVTGSARAFQLHRLLQFGLAGAFIAGGSIAYLFTDNHHSSPTHKVGGAGLLLLYVVQCAIGSWVHRTPAERRTGAQGALLQIMGVAIILLAFIETWLGIASEGHNKRIWSIILFTVPVLYVIGVMTVQRKFGGVEEPDAKGEYVALDTRAPPDDGLEDGEVKL
ncbi:hypothetical protein V8E53_003730 [Lactarius tabidus]